MNISKQNIKNIYPLTPVQQGMLFHGLLDENTIAYFQQTIWRLKGEIRADFFLDTWNLLVENHDVLRTVYSYDHSDRPLQVVLKNRPLKLNFIDLSHHDSAEKKALCQQIQKTDQIMPFDLSQGPLMRLTLIRVDSSTWQVMLSHHHILLDGWSYGLLLSEFIDAYQKLYRNAVPELSREVPFSRFIKWLEAQPSEAAAQYWRDRLSGFTIKNEWQFPNANILSLKDNQLVTVEAAAELNTQLTKQQTTQLQSLALDNGVTVSALLQSIVGVVLQRCYNQNDVVFGVVVSGRPAELNNVESIIGNFINTIPCRINTHQDQSIQSLIKQVHDEHVNSSRFHHHPLVDIQKVSDVGGGLFTVVMAVENYPADHSFKDKLNQQTVGFEVEEIVNFDKTNYDVDFQFHLGEQISLRVIYDSDRFTSANIDQVMSIFKLVTQACIDNPKGNVVDISVINEQDKQKIFCDFINVQATNTNASKERTSTIVDQFNRQAINTPDQPAVSDKLRTLTFQELDLASNQVAHKIITSGAQKQSLVGLCTERSVNLIIAMLGILKAGCAYVPLDTTQPKSRVEHQLTEAKIKLIITDKTSHNDFNGSQTTICVEDCAAQPCDQIQLDISDNDLAYVVYTSGSTGLPKGILIEHHSVISLVESLEGRVYQHYSEALEMGHPIGIALIANSIFDASVQQIFASLLLGHRLYIVDTDTRQNSELLAQAFRSHRIRVADCTPSLLEIWSNSGYLAEMELDCFLVGGEALPLSLVKEVYAQSATVNIINVYGPSECCVDITAYKLERDTLPNEKITPLGTPINNTQLYLLDENSQAVPTGFSGEIYMAGAGQCRGYLSRPELESQKFVYLPHISDQRLYRTGDRGRWTADGQLTFLGRFDHQVKVRGYRIELEEIDSVLNKHENVSQAITVFHQQELLAYIVAVERQGQSNLTVDELRRFLLKSLPEYMLPHQFLLLNKFSLSGSGKIDRAGLTNAEVSPLTLGNQVTVLPQTTPEKVLHEAWTKVLQKSAIGIHDNFFSMGGDSIKAIQIMSTLNRAGYHFLIKDLFQNPTIESLGPLLREKQKTILFDEHKNFAPVTPIQQRFFTLNHDRLQKFNHGILLKFDHSVTNRRFNVDALTAALRKIHTQHPSLKLRFYQHQHQWCQTLSDQSLDFSCVDLLASPQPLEAMEQRAMELQGGFDINKGKLFSATLFCLPDGDRLLLLAHHLVIDGVSWGVLLEDLASCYEQASNGEEPILLAPGLSYIQWVNQLLAFAKGNEILADLPYWAAMEEKIELAKQNPLLGYNDTWDNRYGSAKHYTQKLSQAETGTLLTEVNGPYNTTTEDILLVALARALHQLTDYADHCLLMESHGREAWDDNMDTARCIGWFTSIWPFLLQLPDTDDLGYQIKSIKDGLRRVPRKGLSYQVLKNFDNKRSNRQLSFSLTPTISFNYLGELDSSLSQGSLMAADDAIGSAVDPDAKRPCMLEISAWVIEKKLHFDVNVSVSFTAIDCQQLLELWQQHTQELITHCQHHQETEISPSDLSYSNIDLDELEGIIS